MSPWKVLAWLAFPPPELDTEQLQADKGSATPRHCFLLPYFALAVGRRAQTTPPRTLTNRARSSFCFTRLTAGYRTHRFPFPKMLTYLLCTNSAPRIRNVRSTWHRKIQSRKSKGGRRGPASLARQVSPPIFVHGSSRLRSVFLVLGIRLKGKVCGGPYKLSFRACI